MTTTEDVWLLIDQARAQSPGDVAERATDLLSQRPPAEIVAFAQPLWELLAVSYRADLWAAAYIINGGCSDDGFDYFRGWLLTQGRETFERALADPDSLAGLPVVVDAAARGLDLSDEDMIAIEWDAYRRAPGQEPPPDSFTIRYPTLDPEWGFDYNDRAEMRRRLPRLAQLYFGPTS